MESHIKQNIECKNAADLQSRAKYIKILLGFTKNIDIKRKFNIV